jgi:hypothetical protein
MSDLHLAVIKVGNEITGVFLSRSLVQDNGFEEINVSVIDFANALAPWEDKVVDLIEKRKLIKIAP